MSRPNFLDIQYSLSKRKYLRKPSRTLSLRDRQNSSMSPVYLPNLEEMKQVFDTFDSDRDGKISQTEYKAILRALGKGNSTKEVEKIFEVADLDKDGFIDFREFVEVHRIGGGVKAMDIQIAFRMYDLDGDERISAGEVFDVMKRLGQRCSREDCQRMVAAVDANKDGVIDMDEFMTMMTRSLKVM